MVRPPERDPEYLRFLEKFRSLRIDSPELSMVLHAMNVQTMSETMSVTWADYQRNRAIAERFIADRPEAARDFAEAGAFDDPTEDNASS